MKRGERGFTLTELIFTIALIGIISAAVFSNSFFRGSITEQQEITIEEQFNYALIEYYGILGEYPFAFPLDPANPTTPLISTSTSPKNLSATELDFIITELNTYTGYKLNNIPGIERARRDFDFELVYASKHIASIDLKKK